MHTSITHRPLMQSRGGGVRGKPTSNWKFLKILKFGSLIWNFQRFIPKTQFLHDFLHNSHTLDAVIR